MPTIWVDFDADELPFEPGDEIYCAKGRKRVRCQVRPVDEAVRASVAETGRRGGRARAEGMSQRERSESAMKAAQARWSAPKDSG